MSAINWEINTGVTEAITSGIKEATITDITYTQFDSGSEAFVITFELEEGGAELKQSHFMVKTDGKPNKMGKITFMKTFVAALKEVSAEERTSRKVRTLSYDVSEKNIDLLGKNLKGCKVKLLLMENQEGYNNIEAVYPPSTTNETIEPQIETINIKKAKILAKREREIEKISTKNSKAKK
jgi:hypothetical protein